MYVKEKGRITSKEYQGICNIKKRQATDDLKELEKIGMLKRMGTTEKGTCYILKGHQRGRALKGDQRGRNRYYLPIV